jgi:hypothetical protein
VNCASCGAALPAEGRFCSACGAAIPTPSPGVLTSNVEPATPPIGGVAVRSGPPVWAFIVGGVVAVLVVLGVVGYVFAAPYILASGFRAATYFPRDTWLYGAITLRPGLSQLNASRALTDAFTSQPGFADAVKALNTTPTGTSNLDYEKDVVPLLDGEIAIGAFGSTTQPSYLLMMHSSDPEKLLRTLATSDKAPEPRDRYKGALYYLTSDNRMAAASKGWIVSSATRSVVEQALDRLDTNSSDSLAQSDRYLSVVNRLPSDKLGFLYLDSRPLMNSPQIQQSLSQAGQGVTDYLAPLTARAAVSLLAATDGLEMRWESIPDQAPKQSTFARGNSLTALERMPSDTLVAFGGDSLPAILSGVDQAVSSGLRAELGPQAPRIQFQFDKWLGGEFAAGVSKGTLRLDTRNQTQGSPDVFMVARVKDRGAANTDLGVLDKFFFPKTTTVQGLSLKQVGTTPQTSAYYGVDNDWMYVLYGEPEKFLSQGSGSTGLGGSSQFGQVRRAIASDGVVVFADLDNGRQTLEGLVPPAQRTTYDKSRVLLQPIKALGGSIRADANGDTHGQLLLAISK